MTQTEAEKKENSFSNYLDTMKKENEYISNTIVDKGGAISHHHGVGKDHRKWYLQQLTPQTKHLLNAVKLHLDPNNIMNAGKLFDSNIFENKAN